jgi:hypothetical protein
MFMGPCIVIYFYSKINKIHNFSSLLNITLHVSEGLSVHHQECKTVHTVSCICHIGSLTAYCIYSFALLMMDGKTVRNM